MSAPTELLHDGVGTGPVRAEAPARGGAPARGAAWLAIAAVVAGLILAPPGLGGESFQGVGEVLAGELEVLRAGSWAALDRGSSVLAEEPLRTGTVGARLRVRGGVLTLAPGSRLALERETTILRDGAVLFEGDAIRRVELGAVEVRGRGTFRVDASPSARAGVYRGGIAVSDDTGDRTVGPYEQVELTEGRAGETVPLRYVAEDPWDAALLAAAIAVDRQVDRTAASLRAVYGTQLQAPDFYRDFIAVDDVLAAALPELSPISRDGAFGPPAEALVAVIVTRLLVERSALEVDEATDEISAQRRLGATWGLLLRLHDLRADDLRAAADTALRSRAIAVEEGSAAPVENPPPPEEPGPADTAEPPPAPPDEDPGPGDGDADEGDDGGGDGDPDEGDDDGDDDADDPVGDVIEELPLPIEPPPPAQPQLEGLIDVFRRGETDDDHRRRGWFSRGDRDGDDDDEGGGDGRRRHSRDDDDDRGDDAGDDRHRDRDRGRGRNRGRDDD